MRSYYYSLVILIICDTLIVPTYQLPIISTTGGPDAPATTDETSTNLANDKASDDVTEEPPLLEVFFDEPTTITPPSLSNDENIMETKSSDDDDQVSPTTFAPEPKSLLEHAQNHTEDIETGNESSSEQETSTRDVQEEAVIKFVDVPEDFSQSEFVQTTEKNLDDDNIEEEMATTTAAAVTNEYDKTHPLTSEILEELNSLWAISEQMDDDDEVNSGLKRSLTSLVHMTYARVYDFDEDTTLSKLKTLLRLLRSKLSSHPERKRRSTKEGLKDIISSSETIIRNNSSSRHVSSLKKLNYSLFSRRKNNSRFALEDSFNAGSLSFIPSEENSIIPSFPSWEDGKKDYEVTHHKSPHDKWESHQSDDNSTSTTVTAVTTLASTTTTTTASPTSTSENVALPLTVTKKNGQKPLPLTVMSEKDFSTLDEKDSLDSSSFWLKSNSSGISTESPLAATVDEILSSIIAILNEPQRSTTTTTAATTISFPQINTNDNISDFSSHVSAPKNFSSSLPTYLNSFLVGVPLISSSDLVHASSSSVDKVGDYSKSELNSTSISTNPSQQLQPSSPSSMLNSTMERIVMVVTVFTNLSPSSRMTLAFATAIAGVSLAIGYFVMGAPMIVVGVLALVLTLFFIASLQSSVGKKKKRIDENDIHIHNLIDEDATAAILSLISDAVKLYKSSGKKLI